MYINPLIGGVLLGIVIGGAFAVMLLVSIAVHEEKKSKGGRS